MMEEKKNDGADDPINLFLEQALTRQRDEMMENFSHILQRLLIATGALIQVDIGGHPPIPLEPPPLLLSVSAQFTIFSSFSGPELPEPF
jgi:hypothetical protein